MGWPLVLDSIRRIRNSMFHGLSIIVVRQRLNGTSIAGHILGEKMQYGGFVRFRMKNQMSWFIQRMMSLQS